MVTIMIGIAIATHIPANKTPTERQILMSILFVSFCFLVSSIDSESIIIILLYMHAHCHGDEHKIL